MDVAGTVKVLTAGRELVAALENTPVVEVEDLFRAKAEDLGVKLGDMMGPLRVGVTGSNVSPPLLESCGLIGIDESLRRIDRLIAALKERM